MMPTFTKVRSSKLLWVSSLPCSSDECQGSTPWLGLHAAQQGCAISVRTHQATRRCCVLLLATRGLRERKKTPKTDRRCPCPSMRTDRRCPCPSLHKSEEVPRLDGPTPSQRELHKTEEVPRLDTDPAPTFNARSTPRRANRSGRWVPLPEEE